MPWPVAASQAVEASRAVEHRSCEIIDRVRPSGASCDRRSSIILHMQGLVAATFKDYVQQGLPVVLVAFGSVPLKTFLPDGVLLLGVVLSAFRQCVHGWA